MKRPMRRFSDKLRLLADQAWERGNKDLSSEFHAEAAKEEEKRGKK